MNTDELTESVELAKKIRDWHKDSKDHLNERYKEIQEEYDFYAVDQWSEEDKNYLKNNNRPIITFDRVTPVINSVSGFETSNRDEIKFIPRTLDDAGGNELYTLAAKWARDETDADDEQSDAFKDCIICGYGWTNTEMDYEENPDGIPKEERISPLEMFYHASARKQNLVDSRYVIRAKKLDKAEVNSLWPGKADEIIEMDEQFAQEPHNADEDFLYKNDGAAHHKKKFEVLHCQWWEREPYYRFVDPTTLKTLSISSEKYEKIKDTLLQAGIKPVKQMKKVYYQATVSGMVVLEEKRQLPVQGQFTYECITGYRNERKNTFFGLMKLMMDPQRWSNKFFSQFQDIVASNAKGGAFVEETALSNPSKAEQDWANPIALIQVKEGGINKIKERQQAQVPAAIADLLQISVGATRDVTGINLEFLGLANRDQAGVLESERKRSALVILSDLFNSLRRFKKRQGRILLQYIHRYMRDNQLIRITNEIGVQYQKFKKDPEALTYDVIVDTAPDSPNMKQEAWQTVRELLPTMMSAGLPIPKSILKILPIPNSMAMEWQKEIQEQSQPDPFTEQAKQLELLEKQADIQETNSKALLNQAKAKSESQDDPNEAARIESEILRIQADLEKLRVEAETKLKELQVKKYDADVKLAQSEARLEESKIKAVSEIEKARISTKNRPA